MSSQERKVIVGVQVERPRLARAAELQQEADTELEQVVGWGGEESGYLSDSDTDTETQI